MLILSWSANFFISSHTAVDQAATFSITDTKLYVPVVILSTQNNTKLLQQLKLGFKLSTGTIINLKQHYSNESNILIN